MSEIYGQMALISPDDEPRWDPEIEADFRTGVKSAQEADEEAGLVPKAVGSLVLPNSATYEVDDEEEKKIDRKVDQGVGNYYSFNQKTNESPASQPDSKKSNSRHRNASKGKGRDVTPASDEFWNNWD